MVELPAAALWRRVVAFELDVFFLLLTCIIGFYAAFNAFWIGLEISGYNAPSYRLLESLSLPVAFFTPLAFFSYFIGFASSGGQTPGKAIMRIRVVSSNGKAATTSTIFVRTFGYVLSGMFFGLGFLIAFFTKRHRSLHDFLSGTYVVAISKN